MQFADIVVRVVILVDVVEVRYAQDYRPIAPCGGIEVAQHVIPGTRGGSSHTGVTEDVAGPGRDFIREPRRVSETRIAEGDDEIVAIVVLRVAFAAQDQFELAGGRVR